MKSNAPNKKLEERIPRKDDMKKGYWVVAYRSVSDESAPKEYAELALPALQSFGASGSLGRDWGGEARTDWMPRFKE